MSDQRMPPDAALATELDAVFRSDLMVAKAATSEALREAALASLATLMPNARARVVVSPDPEHPDRLRVQATLG